MVLIPKPAKQDTVKKYRPICLINNIGKVLERVIETRIREFME